MPGMSLTFFQVDAFADRPFEGNPAAVFVLDVPREDRWMQLVAREMNLAETAFLHPIDGLTDTFSLRWFTPAVEVDLCGHATLASAHVLWETGRLAPSESPRFQTRSGTLTARRAGELIEMDFPATTPTPIDALPGLADALGARPRATLRTRFDVLVELEAESTVRSLRPDLVKVRTVDARGVIVTARAERGPTDIISRFFAPQSGVDEDPVTGSAHCALGPYWSVKLGKPDLLAYQASPRGGTLHVKVRGERVLLGGRAITIFRGEMH